MDSLALLAVVGAAVAIAHLAIAGYLYRMSESLEATSEFEARAAQEPREADRTAEGVVCPTCGAANDEFYRYCRSCVTDLSRSGAPLQRRGGDGGLRS